MKKGGEGGYTVQRSQRYGMEAHPRTPQERGMQYTIHAERDRRWPAGIYFYSYFCSIRIRITATGAA